MLIEGAGGSMPESPALQEAFGQSTEPRPEGGLPGAPLLGLCHAGPGLLLKRGVAPRLTHDLAQGQQVHPAFEPGDVLVADRGRCADAPLALLVQADSPAADLGAARPDERRAARERLG